ncbi:hypothetical protein TPHSE_10910 [Terrisporobacter petrolearius]
MENVHHVNIILKKPRILYKIHKKNINDIIDVFNNDNYFHKTVDMGNIESYYYSM